MCIRDRFYNMRNLLQVLLFSFFFLTTQAQVVITELSYNPPESMTDSCLLYTSDAADERSSVDLGGRRIIKKKKMQQKRETTYK